MRTVLSQGSRFNKIELVIIIIKNNNDCKIATPGSSRNLACHDDVFVTSYAIFQNRTTWLPICVFYSNRGSMYYGFCVIWRKLTKAYDVTMASQWRHMLFFSTTPHDCISVHSRQRTLSRSPVLVSPTVLAHLQPNDITLFTYVLFSNRFVYFLLVCIKQRNVVKF